MIYCVKDIENYIIPEHPSFAREYLVVWIFLLSFCGIIMAICDPFVPYIFNIIIPIVIIFDVIGLLLMIFAWKWQKLYTLFSGLYCLAASIVFYIAFFKTVYYIVGITSIALITVTISIYLLNLIASNILVLKLLKNKYYSKDYKNKKKFKGTGILVGFSGIGVLSGRLLMSTTNHQTSMVILALAFLFFSYILTLGTHNIYKYYLLKKYESEVKIYKKDKKKIRKNK